MLEKHQKIVLDQVNKNRSLYCFIYPSTIAEEEMLASLKVIVNDDEKSVERILEFHFGGDKPFRCGADCL
jgi:hypothetical protein